jgi:hypothetical protein
MYIHYRYRHSRPGENVLIIYKYLYIYKYIYVGEDIVSFVMENMREHGDCQKCCQVRITL